MFEIVLSLYNISFVLFVLFINLSIAYQFLNKCFDLFYRDGDIKSGHVLITGCDTGFGYEAALEFSQKNIYVFAGCLKKESVDKLIQDATFNGMAFVMNVKKQEDIENARKFIEDKVGARGLWCLVNNAEASTPGPIEWLSEPKMRETMDINLWGVVNTTKAMIPLLKRANGRIVNTSNMIGRACIENISSYCMTKGALEAFSNCLRHEMKAWGVSVHIIEPGTFGTIFHDENVKQWEHMWEKQSESSRKQYGENFIENIKASKKLETLNKLTACSKSVVKAYLHAALSSRPQVRYVVGVDANTILMTLATLPTSIGDWLYNLLFKRFIIAQPEGKKNV